MGRKSLCGIRVLKTNSILSQNLYFALLGFLANSILHENQIIMRKAICLLSLGFLGFTFQAQATRTLGILEFAEEFPGAVIDHVNSAGHGVYVTDSGETIFVVL